MAVNKYICYCIDEQQFVTSWNTVSPTVCPNNNTHSIDLNNIGIVETMANTSVIISGKDIGNTNGFYLMTGVNVNITANSITINDTLFKIPSSIYGLIFYSDASQTNDYIDIIIDPNTIVGTITKKINVNTNVNVFSISQSVIQSIKPGMNISISDDINTDDLGIVISIDLDACTMTTEKYSINSFDEHQTKVLLSLYIVKNYYIGSPNKHKIGYGSFSFKFVPSNTLFRLVYHNTTGKIKTFSFSYEISF